MLKNITENYKIVLGSNSPRRKQFLEELGIEFTIRASNIQESYPQTYQKEEISDYIALSKANSIPIIENEI
jgi:septum formation protein